MYRDQKIVYLRAL